MKRRILLAGIGVLSACTSVSGVSMREDGHFTVTSHGRSEYVSWNHVRSVGLGKARAWCRQRSRQMHTVAMHTDGLQGVTARRIEIVFDCI